MKLKDKTYKKFVVFFEKISKNHDENEFEIAYSEIQRETGVASITLKKAIQVLKKDGIVEVSPGRNTRYGRFRYLLDTQESSSKELISKNNKEVNNNDEISIDSLALQIKNMTTAIDQLRQRVRTQEMSISVILDRIAELEDNNI
ncbi:MAG: hypothetical protein APF84_17700 [Gracilibacter sp. BRH_c7a]|nr:MAG: hypothetical protein APF84_17700 [Gracilibacter sp. BRH_c7a]